MGASTPMGPPDSGQQTPDVKGKMARHVAISLAVLLFAGARLPADDSKASPPARTARQKEDSCWKARYGKCDGVVRSADLVFVYPTDSYRRDAGKVIKKLQAGWNVLKNLTGIDPVKFFGQRVVVGFRHPSDEGGKECVPGAMLDDGARYGFPGEKWPFINIPWGYLGHQKDQPEECMSHEMVHHYLFAKPLRVDNPKWVEGMCDFLRLPALDAMGMRSVADKRYKLYRSLAWKPGAYFYHDYAGRLIRYSQKHKVDVRKPAQLKEFAPQLWDLDLEATLGQPPP
jgi:hypothetical protein